MLKLKVGEETLGRLRIAYSPLWETVGSLVMLGRGPDSCRWPFSDWARSVVRQTPDALAELVADVANRMPSFLLPVPERIEVSISDELTRLTSASAQSVRDELARLFPRSVPRTLARFASDPQTSLGWYAEELSEFWERGIAPYWPAMRSALDEEVLVRSRTLATEGGERLLEEVRGRFQWAAPWLTVDGCDPCAADVPPQLVIVPLVFARGSALCVTDAWGRISVPYQARGAMVLSEARAAAKHTKPVDRLEVLLGTGRASIVRALATPSTTSAISVQLSLAKSTVSEHLATLVSCGLAQRRRIGGRVLYELVPAGLSILSILDGHSG